MRELRVALYSHDTMGLGHVRRNLLIAHTLADSRLQAAVLLIGGTRRATAFPVPARADFLTLPALRKNADGGYESRSLPQSLSSLIHLRSGVIHAALESFEPDVFVVDNVPRGAARELDAALTGLRKRGRTRIVLGLRDILDEPAAVEREWRRARNEEVIERFYDAVWVYGDPAVYDPVREYRFSAGTADKVRYAGYLDQHLRLRYSAARDAPSLDDLGIGDGPLALCMVGGGQDGVALAEAFARADLPDGFRGLILTGPFMARESQARLRVLVDARPRMRIVEFVAEPARILAQAERVVTMGGYNSTCEALSLEKPALIVPRVKPRTEQWIRAERLRALGLVDVLHPDRLSSEAIGAWLASSVPSRAGIRDRIDMEGLTRLPLLVEEVLEGPVAAPQAEVRSVAV
ncbi:MAG: glycosyltransferase [Acidobacteriota bacterium]